MLPVAVLPAAAIIVGIGHVLDALSILPQVAMFFTSVGNDTRTTRNIICNWCCDRYG